MLQNPHLIAYICAIYSTKCQLSFLYILYVFYVVCTTLYYVVKCERHKGDVYINLCIISVYQYIHPLLH